MISIKDNGRANVVDIRCPESSGIEAVIKGNRNNISVGEFSPVKLRLEILGNNSIVRIGTLRYAKKLRIRTKNNAVVEVGDMTSVEDLYILADEATVSVGSDCMISFGVSIRTTDAHGLYDAETGELINKQGCVTIGDHVWLGQRSIISRSTVIGDGCVVGAKSYVQKLVVPAHSIAAGTPARIVRTGIIWDRRIVKNIKDARRQSETVTERSPLPRD